MTRFLGFALFLVIAAGLAIHAGVQFPEWADWFGRLPGDLIIRKKGLTLYLPLTSSLLISGSLSLLMSFFSKN